ncbi:TetR/AcrR family transcriptional regulator [Actinospica durhamensis]|uniref:TetR/AcrR family transcriptional regulator n=1 Tax=Actinospica durhamensis TaxID=1508375 RepID=A0A941EM78_9ACTN|nr:TetR/AcrR family transcriptional regulator [Actinospica durhamensis]MBR7832938.1 TetR/AcrR family transcriptional regulator [Actinospica durhamensis]
MQAAQGDAPAGRADARRNRELVLHTAMGMFAEEGLEVSLGRIAQRAGVGAGTVYRHFPSKENLLEAVLAEQVEGFVVRADWWAAHAAPGDALREFLLEVIEKSAGRQLVCDALSGDRSWPRALLAGASQRFRAAMERLLDDAKRVGAIRGDVRVEDLSALAVGGIALRSAHSDPARSAMLVRLLLNGLSPAAVTKPEPFRDPSGSTRHETAVAAYCLECGTKLSVGVTGRPPRYCGPTCRQRAHRRRAAAA